MELVTGAPQLAAIGEAMLELSGPPGALRMGFAGDTLNTAIGLARLGVPTAYVTALGDDPYSDAMLEAWRDEGLNLALVERIPGALPGLYAIRTNAAGERQFHYWRGESAARRMLDGTRPAALADALAGVPWLYVSGITLAILGRDGRARLMALLARCAAEGAAIVCDGNYRPALWPDRAEAEAAMTGLAQIARIALPTFEDEAALHGDAAPTDTVARLKALGVPEVVVKHGPDGAFLATDGPLRHIPAPAVLRPYDTSGAGDAFNAGYIAARLRGAAPEAAAMVGHRMAALALQHRGAIPPRDAVLAAGVLA